MVLRPMIGIALAVLSAGCFAQDEAPGQAWDAKFQSTYVWQQRPAMRSPYEGAHSLLARGEKSYTFSATAFLGLRLSPTTEFYLNPEAVQGVPLSRLQGLGGMANGEAQKTSGPRMTAYIARAFIRHTWSLDGASQAVEAEKNQLAGSQQAGRVVLTAGNFAVNDIFDRSSYSGDPRTQFLNWSFMTHGAFDFPADARGYTWGAALEWTRAPWTLRAGRFLLPREPNGAALDWRAGTHFGDVIELVRTHELAGREGNVRLLAFRDRAVMARYDDALAAAFAGGTPSLDAVRTGEKTKRGWGIAIDQAVSRDVGVFARAARADGRTEVYAFAEIDSSLSVGALFKGAMWRRAEDTLGIALAHNSLSRAHRNYLAAGGLGYFIGDGALAYGPETIFEIFYSVAIGKHCGITLDTQRIRNPAYNSDRGPVRVTSARLHAEF